jgi:hypothetical protein
MSTTKPRSSSHRILVASLSLACALSLTAGTAPSSASPSPGRRIPVVEVTVDSRSITAPSRLTPGFTTFHTTSTHPGTDSLAVVRLRPGVTYVQIFRYIRSGNLAAVFRHVWGKGGIAHGGRHNGREWTTDLHRGLHLFVDDEANLFAKLRVTGRRHPASRPDTDGTIWFDHGTFRLPRRFHDGTWRLHNDDTIQHEIALVRIHGGHTRADVKRVLAAGTHPSWLEPQATVNLVGAHRNAWATLDDLRGFYVFLDYLPMYQGMADVPVAKFRRIPR